jgi:superfamily II DNA/RNA helicase/very-short-patch-repair endonuclease
MLWPKQASKTAQNPDMIDILDYHKSVLEKYRSYIQSFVAIRDERIRTVVDAYLHNQKGLWNDPLIQFNPGYETGKPLSELSNAHPLLSELFPFQPHKHQEEAVQLGLNSKHFVVISGTGSGKSLTYMASVFNHLLQVHGPVKKQGVHALIVYPMNALINSQVGELDKLREAYEAKHGKNSFPFSFEKYTGQESERQKQRIIEDKPNIILTNYVMLELMLVRAKEQQLRDSIFDCLHYLVFDELHTYRGRQGADVAMLIRRLHKEAKKELVCIGTSATMSSGGSPTQQKEDVSMVASRIFGVPVPPEQIVTETLRKVVVHAGSDMAALQQSLTSPIDENGSESCLLSHPLAAWLEQHIALKAVEGKWYRNEPKTLPNVIEALRSASGMPVKVCEQRLKEILNLIQAVNVRLAESGSRTSYLQFRLHQFFLQTGTAYCTLENRENREIRVEKEVSIAKNGEMLPLFSVAFSRISGETFYRVNVTATPALEPWTDVYGHDAEEEAGEEGYFLLSPSEGEDFWDDDPAHAREELPLDWFNPGNRERIRKERLPFVPRRMYVNRFGHIRNDPAEGFLPGWFLKAPLLFDPTSGAFYDSRTRDATKLARIGNEGRGTATTIISLSAALALSQSHAPREVQKVMSFTDNRQDAALQAGHYNDFVNTVLIRSAIYHAVSKNSPLDYSNIALEVAKALNLSQVEFAREPGTLGSSRAENEKALRLYLKYRILDDLRYSWRVILPNLEQCGLLKIEYTDLDELSTDPFWIAVPMMLEIAPDERRDLLFLLVNYIRNKFAIRSDDYEEANKEQNINIVQQKLIEPWRFDRQEQIFAPNWMRVEPVDKRINTESLHYMSAWGRYLKNFFNKKGHPDFRGERVNELTVAILQVLTETGYLSENKTLCPAPLYQLPIDRIRWVQGDRNTVYHDRLRLRLREDKPLQPNRFFQEFYTGPLEQLKYRLAGEHTGQLKNEKRQFYEAAFRHDDDVPKAQRLSALFCSPTMELGIDIRELNTVHLRNIPPSPANYVQRAGRAGRSGQGALVLAFCGNQSPHDRYYYEHQGEMVHGVVTPPNLDLSNEELWRTHLHSMYLAACALDAFDRSVEQLLDIEQAGYHIRPEVAAKLRLQERAQVALVQKALDITRASMDKSDPPLWYHDHWAAQVIARAPQNFDQAFARWRNMYREALAAKQRATQVINHHSISRSHPDYKNAKREMEMAQERLDQLRNNGHSEQSEFFPYRYLASEGFLPGYNFPRLPRRLWLETSTAAADTISRPRLLALTEFGPQNTVYYDGQKYQVNSMMPGFDNEGMTLRAAKISKKSGFILFDQETKTDTDPFSGADLSHNGNVETLANLLELQDGRARQVQRISCEEEERMRKGFEEKLYFRTDHAHAIQVVRIFFEGDHLLNLRYIPTAQIVKVNLRWRASRTQDQGFAIHKRSGKWLTQKQVEEMQERGEEALDNLQRVHLYATDTANALYLEPCARLNLSPDGVLTMMYALKRALEIHFQVEPREMGATLMGDPEQPNIFIYEAAEGSLGILSQITRDAGAFQKVAETAYKLCCFANGADVHPNGELCPASYSDLLDYFNQRDHTKINRLLIKNALELLKDCRYDIGAGDKSYGELYQWLCSRTDPNSAMERQLLDYLYLNGLRLPDRAQINMSNLGCYVSADFVFDKERIAVFVDGSVHDQNWVADGDTFKRECLERLGWETLVWHHRQPLSDFIAAHPHIFTQSNTR